MNVIRDCQSLLNLVPSRSTLRAYTGSPDSSQGTQALERKKLKNCNSEICRPLGSVRTDHIRRYVLARYDLRLLSPGDPQYAAFQPLPILLTDHHGCSESDRQEEDVLIHPYRMSET